VVKSDGAIYFTDPWNIAPLPQQWDLGYNGVFRAAQRARLFARREGALHQ
jgi:hypothetical protein